MKKGQVSSQVFTYILAAVIVAVILFVGAKAVGTIIKVGGGVGIDEFKNEITGKIDTISRQYGSVSRHSFTLPDKYEEICFADSRSDDNVFSQDLKNSVLLSQYPFVKDHITADAEGNIFLLKNKLVEDWIEVKDLDVRDDFLCFENQGLIEVGLKGTGKKAELYIPPAQS